MVRSLWCLALLVFGCSSGPTGPGTIRVTVSGVAASVGSGGSVVATGGDGQTFALELPATKPSTGSSSGEIGGVPPGSWEVAYTPPNGHRLIAAALGKLTVEVTSGATAMVTFAAQPVPQPALEFASDWHGAAGNTEPAVRDGTKWDLASGFELDRVSVVSSAGLSFPAGMSNVLAVRYSNTDAQASSIAKLAGWPLPAVGASVWFRVYVRYTLDGTGGAEFHPVQPCSQADTCCAQAWWGMARQDTDFFVWSISLETGNPATQHQWATTLSRNVTYRLEEQWQRTGNTTWLLHLRVYDQNESLIRDDTSFGCLFHGAGTHALSDAVMLETASPTCLQTRLIGNPGVAGGRGSDNAAANRVYYGGFAVSVEDWVGQYVPGEAG